MPIVLWGQNQLTPEVISNGGEVFSNSNYVLSFTIGEPMVETYQNGNHVLTQGFQQPSSRSVTNTENTLSFIEIDISPNPFQSTLNLNLSFEEIQALDISIVDALGRTVLSEKRTLKEGNIEINTAQIPSGFYFLKIQSNSTNQSSTFKIVKS